MPILLWFLLLPILEIIGFIQVGDWIGAGPTIGLLVLSAVIGVLLIRHRGLTSLSRLQGGALGADAALGGVLDSVCVVLAGILLIVPGFLSDLVALVLLVPPLRRGLGRWLIGRLAAGNAFRFVNAGGFAHQGGFARPEEQTRPHAPRPGAPPYGAADPGVIDGEFVTLSDPPPPSAPGTPRLSDSQWGKTRPDGRD